MHALSISLVRGNQEIFRPGLNVFSHVAGHLPTPRGDVTFLEHDSRLGDAAGAAVGYILAVLHSITCDNMAMSAT